MAESSVSTETTGLLGWREIISIVSPAAPGLRAARVMREAPSSASASPVEAAVAPAPRITPEVQVKLSPARSRMAATAPGRSVLSPTQPCEERTSVLTAPTSRARGETDRASS